jgi:hypothetical protein
MSRLLRIEPLGRPAAAPRIRLATPTDAPRLAELRLELRTALAPEVEPEAGFRERCAAWMADRPRSRPLYARHGFMERAGVLERRLWSRP